MWRMSCRKELSNVAFSRQSAVQYSLCRDRQPSRNTYSEFSDTASLSPTEVPVNWYCATVQFGSLRPQTHIPRDNSPTGQTADGPTGNNCRPPNCTTILKHNQLGNNTKNDMFRPCGTSSSGLQLLQKRKSVFAKELKYLN